MGLNGKINLSDEIEDLRKKLLDMSLRNNFLNFKVYKRTIPVVDNRIKELFENLIVNEQSVRFLPKDDELQDSENENNNETQVPDDYDDLWKIVKKDSYNVKKTSDVILQTDLTEKNLQKSLFTLYQNYKTSITEKGLNTLFLALGFLEWKDSQQQDGSYKAPLILIPVEISRDSVGSPFTIKWDKSDIFSNISQYGIININLKTIRAM